MLNLTRPLIVFDLETTGINTSTDRIVELYMIKLTPDGEREDVHEYINPGRPIPPEVTAIHGISDEMVKDKPQFGAIAPFLDPRKRFPDLALRCSSPKRVETKYPNLQRSNQP